MPQTKRHKVFISYYHEDNQEWTDRFKRIMVDKIVDWSVDIGDIADNSPSTADTLRRIREEHISQATATVVLIGSSTWQRKYVDWEIGATLRDTDMNPRCGLLGILLPTHPDHNKAQYNPRLIPPRLADNLSADDPFAFLRHWPGQSNRLRADNVQDWIDQAFTRRKRQPDPDISRHPFSRNWTGECSRGWQS